MLFIQKFQRNISTKEQRKYKNLLIMQTSENADLCPSSSIARPQTPVLLLGMDFLLQPLLVPEVHLDAVVGGVFHLRLWIQQN
jgi:hypothetical protein